MSEEIKVSVICLAYNHAKYVRKTLEGFVSQKTDFPIEVLIHDDASTDETADIIREYAQKYDFIKPIFQTENQFSKNVSVTREIMLPRVQGKYVAFCEGDDYWTDVGKLQMQADYLDNHPDCAMCCHAYHKIDAADEHVIEVIETLDREGDITPEQAIVYKRPSQLATQMFRTEVIRDMPPVYHNVGVGDYPMLLKAVAGGRIHYFDRDMAAYRVASVGSWTSRIYRDVNKQLAHWDRIREFLIRYDQFNEGRFSEAVRKKLDSIDFSCAVICQDYKRARSCEQYNEMPLYRKMVISCGCYLPGLAKTIERIVDRMRGK